MTETCANCGAAIGKLETPYVFQDQTVCGACHARLNPTLNYAAGGTATLERPRVQVIEQTAKTWKFLMLIGALVSVGGFATLMVGLIHSTSTAPFGDTVVQFAFAFLILGFLVALVARFMAWWNHG